MLARPGAARALALGATLLAGVSLILPGSANAAFGDISTFAGTPHAMPATAAALQAASGVAVAPDGSIVVADQDNHRVRRIAPSGLMTTVAGTGYYDYYGTGYNGDNRPATTAELKYPTDVAVAADGSILIADYGNHRVSSGRTRRNDFHRCGNRYVRVLR